ncbi:MAG: family 78 glycoside hydrolase catalytic domain [Lachnospiraceae bacterium]|nr:family 78 glycoside hydrolase catalytic domain [Lachnospiraceae bacterium]
MKIVNTRVNHLINPIGYQLPHLSFSYQVEEAAGKHQSAARIAIYADADRQQVLYDTGRSESISSLSHNIDLTLKPCTRYYWDVTVWSDAGEEAVSECNYFETGLLDQSWQGLWIGCDDTEPRHPVFCRELKPEGEKAGKTIAAARLYICGLGLYEARIGNQKVGNEILTPYCNNYQKWIQYQTYDVTQLLAARAPEDELRITLGNGWYKGRFGFNSSPGSPAYYGDSWKLIAQLVITYQDGTQETIGTDGSWRVERSTITLSNIYDGEHRDDTLPALPAVPAVVLGTAQELKEELPLTERLSIPVTVHEQIRPIALLDTPAGEKVYDLGQNQAGIFRLHVHEPAGTRIHVQVGEVLQQGNFYRDNLRSALAEYWYTSDGEEHVLEPQFTFYGYRYAKVEGASNLTIDDFTGLSCYSDFTPAGHLTTGMPKINQLLSNIFWGQKGNFVDVPTDCPQRDERMGWTADTQVFVPTACYYSDPYAFYNKFLYDIRTEQSALEGKVPDVVPSFGMPGTGSSVWGDAATIIPWTLYEFYGDRNVLADSIQSMKDWVDWVTRTDGDDHGYGRNFHFGDWLALDNPAGGVDQVKGGTEDAFVAYVYYYNSARIVERSARVLGLAADEEKYAALADRIYEYIQDEYFTKNGRLAIETQTGYVLALYYALTEHRDRQVDSLIRLLKAHKNHFVTGFVGTPLIQKVLSKEGYDELAYRILMNEDFPSWLYEINLGATTVWERWNSMSEDGSVSSTGMNSFNHYAYGSVGEWMFRTIAGLNASGSIEEPGFKKARIRPIPNWRLQCAAAEYTSPAGKYNVSWEVKDMTHVHLQVTVPFDAEAVLELPLAKAGTVLPWSGEVLGEARCTRLQAGSYELTYETDATLVRIYTAGDRIEDIFEEPAALAAVQTVLPGIEQAAGFMRMSPLEAVILERLGDNEQSHALLDQVNAALKESALK